MAFTHGKLVLNFNLYHSINCLHIKGIRVANRTTRLNRTNWYNEIKKYVTLL